MVQIFEEKNQDSCLCDSLCPIIGIGYIMKTETH